MNRRIEQHQRIPTPAHLQRMHHRSHGRDRMEYAGRRLGAPSLADRVPYTLVVLDESFPVVMGRMMRRILAVIAKVVNDDVVAIEKLSPERKIAIYREPVAVAQHQARRFRPPMTAHAKDGALLHRRIENPMWPRDACQSGFRHRTASLAMIRGNFRDLRRFMS